jgi:8-oxo-dGTP pyrophosphatase MutT (NUDIX family)
MVERFHRAVGIIITNPDRTKFYIQQKDETYYIIRYRLHYTFFGGAIEDGESEEEALKRELNEELDESVIDLMYKKLKKLGSFSFTNILKKECLYTLFESIISDEDLDFISNKKVFEGKRGVLISRDKIRNIDFFSELKNILEKYLSEIS